MSTTRGGEPLAGYRSVRTRDPDDAQARLSGIFSPHVLVTGGAGFDARANALDLGHVKIVYLALGAAATVRPEPLSYFAANIALRGAGEVRLRSGVVQVGRSSAGSVINPGHAFAMRWAPDYRQLSVLVEQRHLEARLGPGSSRRPTRLASTLDVGDPAVRSWLALVRWVVEDADRGGITRSPLAAAQARELLVAGLLRAQHDDGEPGVTATGAGRVARAVDFLHEHLDEPISVTDIATAAGVGVRALQSAFHREFGVSPSTYLRDARLDRVRAELSGHAGPPPAGVAATATRWGFTHVPRFAGLYRRRFGEAPSQTLRRARA